METWPDPDSEEMGHWVDHWLMSLRQEGLRDRQLEALARHLARAANQEWQGQTPVDRQAVERFWNWYVRQIHPDEKPPV
jgi:hypothetical protein